VTNIPLNSEAGKPDNDWQSDLRTSPNLIFGTVALALGSYILLAYTSRELSAYEYSLFATFWSVVMGLILGATAPLESFGLSTTTYSNGKLEINHQLIHAIKIVFGMTFLVTMLSLPWFLPRVFDGRWSFLIATLIAIVGFLLIYTARGILIVEHRSSRYAAMMTLESFLRVSLAIVIIAVIGPGGSSVALAVSAAALIAGLISFVAVRTHLKVNVGPKNDHEIAGEQIKQGNQFIPLLAASMAIFVLLNLGPFVVQFLSGAQTASAGIFLNALTLSRVPILLGPILQARLLPSISSILRSGESITMNKLIGTGMRRLAVLGLLFAAGFVILGETAINTLFGGKTSLDKIDLLLLAIPTVLYLIAVAFQSVLVALGENRIVAKVWLIGLTSYLLTLFAPLDPVRKVEVAGVVALVLVTVGLYLQLARKMRQKSAAARITEEII
jgi:O-antigen/teichoic acid export membrane protein